MIKRHTVTGLRYFCKSTVEKYERYKGSGDYWNKHIKKHGTKHVITEWTSEPFTNPTDVEEFALLFSELHNVVKSNLWANEKPENGLDGGGPGPGEEGAKKLRATFSDPEWKATTGKERTRKSIEGFKKTTSDPEWKATTGAMLAKNASERFKGVPKSLDTRKKMSETQLANGGNGPSQHSAETKEKLRIASTGRVKSEETRRRISEANKGQIPWCTGIPQPIVTCPHCDKSGGDRNMKRYHFDKCKVLINIV